MFKSSTVFRLCKSVIFARLLAFGDRQYVYENSCESSLLDSNRGNVHHFVCRGQAELQEDRQELPDERQQGMQLREELCLRQEVTEAFGSAFVRPTIKDTDARVLLGSAMKSDCELIACPWVC